MAGKKYFIETGYHEDIQDTDVNEIAGKAFVSSFYFQKIFNCSSR